MSDWSSDVCSADLQLLRPQVAEADLELPRQRVVLAAGQDQRVVEQRLRHEAVERVGQGDQADVGDAARQAVEHRLGLALLQPQLPRREPAAQFRQAARQAVGPEDRKSVVWGKSVAVREGSGGGRIIKKQSKKKSN